LVIAREDMSSPPAEQKVNKQARKLLQEISELEKTWHKAVNKRVQLIEQMRNQEKKEIKFQEELQRKKQDLRLLIESSGNNTFSGLSNRKRMYSVRRTYSLTFVGPVKDQSDPNILKQELDSTPRLLESIQPEDSNQHIFSVRNENSAKNVSLLADIKIVEVKDKKLLANIYGPRYQCLLSNQL
jgi:hypothetical protein